MDALELLSTRTSNKKLTAPAPNAEELRKILRTGLRAPDHGRLKPYHFTVIYGDEQFAELRELLLDCCREHNLADKFYEKAEKFGKNFPMVIAVTTRTNLENLGKVPVWEQEVTAGCATYAIQLAAKSLGYDTFWISGKWPLGTKLRQRLGCEKPEDKIIALLAIGTAKELKCKDIEREVQELDQFISYW